MHINTYVIYENGADEPICRAEIEVQTSRMNLWTQREKKRVVRTEGSISMYILPCVK